MKREDIITALTLFSPVIVFLVLLILKLADLIVWSWWWVTISLWGTLALTLIVALLFMAVLFYKIHKR